MQLREMPSRSGACKSSGQVAKFAWGVCGYSALWLRRIDNELIGMELKPGSPIRCLAENRLLVPEVGRSCDRTMAPPAKRRFSIPGHRSIVVR
jgi:hypothetical protein